MPHPDHEKNRAAWNQIVDLHIDHPEYRTKEVIEGGSSLKPIELEALGDVKGRSLLHLMCQFGLDSLSWARLGAEVTGVDISDQSIHRANEIMARHVSEPYPARAAIGVSQLPRGASVEIEGIMVLPG